MLLMITAKDIKYFIRDSIRKVLSPKLYIKLRFYLTHRYFCNLNVPKTWNEKIQYRKLNSDPSDYSKYVDKYTVRQYVSTTIGSEYLIPLIGKFRKITPPGKIHECAVEHRG